MVAIEDDEFLAAVAGLLLMNVAGEVAAEGARGPGTFVPALLDTIATLEAARIVERARLA
jgi:hydroxyethylthiazole kinase